MIGFVRGVLDSVFEDRVLVDNNGVGYEIFVPGSVIDSLPHMGEEIKLYTYLHVREDVMQLYGFLTADALSPPPTTVVPLHSAIASATALVPPANAGNSNTPIGPFQSTVPAFLISSA